MADATTFKAKATTRAWKQHTCEGCGGIFRYKMSRAVEAQGETEEDAAINAERESVRQVEEGTDIRPCPHCGALQPAMVAASRSTPFLVGLIVLVVLFGAIYLLGVGPAIVWFSYGSAAMAAGAVSAAAVIGYWCVAVRRPSNRPSAAAKLVADRQLEAVSEPNKASAGLGSNPTPQGTNLWMSVALFGALLTWSPLIAKVALGWASNADLKPDVAGPGDAIQLWLDQPIESLSGRHATYPHGTLTDRSGVTHPMKGIERAGNWGNSINVKSDDRNKEKDVSASLILPDEPALAGQTVTLDVDVGVTYPVMVGGGFDVRNTSATIKRQLTLSSPRSKRSYQITLGVSGFGAILVLLAGFVLLGKVTRLGTPLTNSTVVPIHEADDLPWKSRPPTGE